MSPLPSALRQPFAALSSRRVVLWFSFLGGAAAWSVHFAVVYLLSEWGCLAGWGHYMLWGWHRVAWLGLLSSVILLAIALAATLVAYGAMQRSPAVDEQSAAAPEFGQFMAHAGMVMNLLFALIIVFETLPLLYFLNIC